MKSLILITLLFIGQNCKSQSLEYEKNSNKNTTLIQVTFFTKGGLFLNYLDENYKNAGVVIKNSIAKDTTILKKINITNPTVFKYYGTIRDSFEIPFISLTNDTIKLFQDKDLKFKIHIDDTLNNIFSNIFLITNRKAFYKPILFKDFFKRQIVSEVNHKKNIETINRYVKSGKVCNLSIFTAMNNYNDTRYYSSITNVLYNSNTSNINNVKKSMQPIIDTLKNNLDKISKTISSELKDLSYNITEYCAFQKNKIGETRVNKIIYIDSAFHKKRYLDGYIKDIINFDVKSFLEQKQLLDKYKHILLEYKDSVKSFQLVDTQIYLAKLVDLKSNIISGYEILKSNKKLILLDFWASWCTPCIAEIPLMEYYKNKYKNDLQVVSISIDDKEDNWVKACNKHKITSNSYLIQDGKNNDFVTAFEISSIPRYVLLSNIGHLISSDFYRPSDPNFSTGIDKSLNALSK